jgi:hypothetical protein
MAQIITGIYPDPQTAMGAVDALRQRRFSDTHISVILPGGTGEDDPHHKLEKAGISPKQASFYTDAVSKGRSLVVVRPPFGTSAAAAGIMEGFGPVEWGIEEDEAYVPDSPDAAPLSASLNWPLLSHNPTWLSSKWNWPVLSTDPAPLSTALGFPLLSKRQESSASAKVSELSGNPAPLSAMLGLRVLLTGPETDQSNGASADVAAPLSARAGWRMLINDPAPLSSWLKIRTLLNEHTDGSAVNGLGDNPAPLSSTLKAPTLVDTDTKSPEP